MNTVPKNIIEAAQDHGWTWSEPAAPTTWIIETYVQLLREQRTTPELFNLYHDALNYNNAIYKLMQEAEIYVESLDNLS